jgi:hypothetical protein
MSSIIQLSNGRSVNSDFLNCINTAITERINLLPRDRKLPLVKIVGEGFWDLLTNGERRTAGWIMKHLVDIGELPLTVAETRHEYPIHYQVKE